MTYTEGSDVNLIDWICNIFLTTSEPRERVSILNAGLPKYFTSSASASGSCIQLEDPQIGRYLSTLFVSCVGRHRTMMDIIKHVLESFAVVGLQQFTENLGSALLISARQSPANQVVPLLEGLLSFSTGRAVLMNTGKCEILTDFLEELRRSLIVYCECGGQYDKYVVEVEKVGFLVSGLNLVDVSLEVVLDGAVKACSERLDGLLAASACIEKCIPRVPDRHQVLIHAVSRTAWNLRQFLNRLGALQSLHTSSDPLELPKSPGLIGIFAVEVRSLEMEDFLRRYASIRELLDSSLKTFPFIAVEVSVAFCERLCRCLIALRCNGGVELIQPSEADSQGSMGSSGRLSSSDYFTTLDHTLLDTWTQVMQYSEDFMQSKGVEILASIMVGWKVLSGEVQESILAVVTSLAWSSVYKIRCWTMLLNTVNKTCFKKYENVDALWLLRNIPEKFCKAPLAELITKTATAEDIAKIFLETSKFNQFLMKNVLPSLAKDGNFIVTVLTILQRERNSRSQFASGYGSLLYLLRTTKRLSNDTLRRQILDEFVFGVVDLAVVSDDLVRLEAFDLLCELGVPLMDFNRFCHFVEHNLDHQFTKFREPLVRSAVKFLTRIEVILRQTDSGRVETVGAAGRPTNGEQLQGKLNDFLCSLVDQCVPSSSYARRTTSLQIIRAILRLKVPTILDDRTIWSTVSRTFMEQVFWETFPDNQQFVADILILRTNLNSCSIGGFPQEMLRHLADSKARSCAANAPRTAVCLDSLVRCQTDSVEMVLCEILRQLKGDITLAVENGISWASRKSPLYGQVFRMRTILEMSKTTELSQSFVEEVFTVCWPIPEYVNRVFADHTTNFSMDHEVFLSHEQESNPEWDVEENTTAQMLFVCCWRCVRETALFFSEICCGKASSRSVHMSHVKKVFSWLVDQLLVTRHTGTFESLAEQIVRVSRFLVDSRGQDGSMAVFATLNNVIEELTGDWNSPLMPENTRKSAGIPRLLCILFSALRRTERGDQIFEETTTYLLVCGRGGDMANQRRTDDRVRAINVLEAIFRESALTETSEKFVASGFTLALEGVSSHNWSIRNSCACLFTAIMQKVFGPGVKKQPEDLQWRENCLPMSDFFRPYPAVLDYMLDSLRRWTASREVSRHSDGSASGEYSMLLILSRLYKSAEDAVRFSDLLMFLWNWLAHPHIRIREMAARSLVRTFGGGAFVGLAERISTIVKKTAVSDHEIHGLLLVLKEAQRCQKWLPALNHDYLKLGLQEIFLSYEGLSFFTRTVLMDVSLEYVKRGEDFKADFHRYVKRSSEDFDWTGSTSQIGAELWMKTYFHCAVTLSLIEENPFDLDSVQLFVQMWKNTALGDHVKAEVCAEFARFICSGGKISDCGSFLRFLMEESEEHDQLCGDNFGGWLSLTSVLISLVDWIPRKWIVSRLDHCLQLMESEENSEVLAVAMDASSNILKCCGNRDEFWGKRLVRYLDCVRGKVIESGSVDLRMCCARALVSACVCAIGSWGSSRLQKYYRCYHWIIVLNLLRDDDPLVRAAMASRLEEFGLSGAYSSSYALDMVMEHLVRTYTEDGVPEIVISLISSEYLNDNDQLARNADVEGVVFENCDRHEFHENLRIMQLLARHTKNQPQLTSQVNSSIASDKWSLDGSLETPPSVEDMGTRRIMEAFIEEMELCERFLSSCVFLDNMAAFKRSVFRFCGAAYGLAALRSVNGEVRKFTKDFVRRAWFPETNPVVLWNYAIQRAKVWLLDENQ